jgi:hypothetical protein
MRRSLLLLWVAAVALGPVAADAQQPASYSYDFRASGDGGGHAISGTTRVSGSRGRIDVTDNDGDGQYLLLSGNGQVVTLVHPSDRTYTIFSADDFAHIASLGVGVASRVLTMKVRGSSFETSQLGAGDRILGRATQRVRLVEHWDMDVGAMGFTTPMRHTVETEFYFDPSLTLARNPLLEIVATTATILPATDPAYAAREDSLRRTLVHGMPLRTVVTEREENGHVSRMVVEVTRYGPATIDDADLQVPAGYTRKDNKLSGFRLKL